MGAALRLPGLVLSELEVIAGAVVGLQQTAERRLASIDRRAGQLVVSMGALETRVAGLEAKIDQLTGLEETIERRTGLLSDDLNERMLAAEAEVHGLRPPIDQIARDVQVVVKLLPNPSDGPLARLRDTLTSS